MRIQAGGEKLSKVLLSFTTIVEFEPRTLWSNSLCTCVCTCVGARNGSRVKGSSPCQVSSVNSHLISWGKVSLNLGFTDLARLAGQRALVPGIGLPMTPQCWDCRCTLLHPFLFIFVCLMVCLFCFLFFYCGLRVWTWVLLLVQQAFHLVSRLPSPWDMLDSKGTPLFYVSQHLVSSKEAFYWPEWKAKGSARLLQTWLVPRTNGIYSINATLAFTPLRSHWPPDSLSQNCQVTYSLFPFSEPPLRCSLGSDMVAISLMSYLWLAFLSPPREDLAFGLPSVPLSGEADDATQKGYAMLGKDAAAHTSWQLKAC
jgi:hypothetical protein